MPLTTIDSVPALVVIDMQKGITGMIPSEVATTVVGNIVRLLALFRSNGWPVVLVNVAGRAPGRTQGGAVKLPAGNEWTELIPELTPQSSDKRITKYRFGAFLGTDLGAYLDSRGATQIFLAGISTSAGVESTGRSAYDLGYNVVFVADAMTDRSAEAHQHCVTNVFPRVGEVTSTEEVVGFSGK